jgi:hypothetical protein
MKKSIFILIMGAVMTLTLAAEEKRIPVTLAIDGTVLQGYLNNTTSAQDLISRLPLTLTLRRYVHDYCGGITPPLKYEQKDVQFGWHNGDLAFWTAGNDFVIFWGDEEISSTIGDLVIIGAVTSSVTEIRSLPPGAIQVRLALAQ